MNWKALLKHNLGKLAGASLINMGDIIILTSIAGWLASSAAQIIGIAINKNYTREQKKYMISQESADALTNILLYFGVTKSLTALSSHMVKTGKLAPKSIATFLENNNLASRRGDFNFDVTSVPGFNAAGLGTSYNTFKAFTDAGATTIGGIISSNIITPIVRNRIAAYRQNKYKERLKQLENPMNPTFTSAEKPEYNNYSRHTFNDFRNRVLSI